MGNALDSPHDLLAAGLWLANFLLATAMWLVLGRLVMRPLVRNPSNPVWQVFLIATEPVYRVSRLLTAGRMPEGALWLVSLAWLVAARLLVVHLRGLLVE